MMVLMLSNIEIKRKNQSAYAKSKICRAIDTNTKVVGLVQVE